MRDPRFAEHLAVFVEVVRHGSFSGAARRRGQTPSAIVRQIDALEHSLGVPLLIRSTRALTMTDAGERLHERAQPLLDQLIDTHAEIAAFDGAIAGTFRLACFPTFGKRYVIPALERVMADHPGLAVELDLTERLADPVRERLDAVIRIGRLADSTLIASKLADQRRLLVASPGYLERAGRPETLAELAGHRLIDKLHGADLLGWGDIAARPGGAAAIAQAIFRCDDFEAMRLACLAGIGIAFLPDWVVGHDVQAGRLERLGPGGEHWNATPTGVWLLRALAQPSACLRIISAALREAIGDPPVWGGTEPRQTAFEAGRMPCRPGDRATPNDRSG
ncbi:LysR family transcriptional regulator [Sphingomonas sp.]|uniref:LysR family transcriptional regulator n=1 Tax=Sphingomonas sp. TaxID=28214 RepID=UPI000DB2FA4D|nr:LysR family transcriptional regulator [Sphingomonas sp.]PZU10862.1 MAG: LysR family transcriptional regulator [Sphingomonas sp.]